MIEWKYGELDKNQVRKEKLGNHVPRFSKEEGNVPSKLAHHRSPYPEGFTKLA